MTPRVLRVLLPIAVLGVLAIGCASEPAPPEEEKGETTEHFSLCGGKELVDAVANTGAGCGTVIASDLPSAVTGCLTATAFIPVGGPVSCGAGAVAAIAYSEAYQTQYSYATGSPGIPLVQCAQGLQSLAQSALSLVKGCGSTNTRPAYSLVWEMDRTCWQVNGEKGCLSPNDRTCEYDNGQYGTSSWVAGKIATCTTQECLDLFRRPEFANAGWVVDTALVGPPQPTPCSP